MAPSACIVVDLGFGDSGKGKIVDYLARRLGSKLVVRFNGGAQAAHNVVTPDGLHHTFSQWGSGALAAPDVDTLLTSDVAIHPLALQAEAEHLESIGVREPFTRLLVSRDCLVTTPFHQALNCLRELRRGDDRHGSCGVGHGETVRLAPIGVRARDLHDARCLRGKLQTLREIVLEETSSWHPCTGVWSGLLADPQSVDRTGDFFQRVARRLRMLDEADIFRLFAEQDRPVIFEGAQGVLLDETFGFAPYYTWSTTTGRNALKYREAFGHMRVLGVLRAYPTRHGAGPFPTEDDELSRVLADPRNPPNCWQGSIRTGWFDPRLLQYALMACDATKSSVGELAITHLDAIPRVGVWRCGDTTTGSSSEVVSTIARVAELPVTIESYGPRSVDTGRRLCPNCGQVRVSQQLFE